MTMPVMEPDLDAAMLEAWARTIDEGPFSSLCWGERIAFDNPEAITLLGALAAWTDRVRLVTTVVVPQLHDPVMLAKALATGDMLSGGRLTVGLGIGGRREDYEAVGADPATQTMRGMADRVAVMKRVWAGEKVTDSVVPGRTRAAAERRGRRCSSGRWAPRPCSPPHPGPTALRAPLWTSTPPSRTSCTTSREPRGRRRESPNPFWRRRSGSRSATATKRALRFTDICAAT